jgi:hypothetical protein
MNGKGSVALFVSGGANAARNVDELVTKGEKVDRDAFGPRQARQRERRRLVLQAPVEADWGRADACAEIRLLRSAAAANDEDRHLIRQWRSSPSRAA